MGGEIFSLPVKSVSSSSVHDTSHNFGGGLASTTMNPIVLVAILLCVGLTFGLPRKYAILPILAGIFTIPLGQSVYILGVHWLGYRIIVMGGLARVLVARRALFPDGLSPIDRAFIGSAICQSIAFVLQYMVTDALVNQFAFLIDFAGAYIVLRGLLQTEADVYRALRLLAGICLILGTTMFIEQRTLTNVFGLLGGTRLVPEIREGKIRSQGVFSHSITAGVFGGTLLVPFILLWRNTRSRFMAAVGIVGCTLITICSNSSTPLLAYAAGIFGAGLWPLRRHMRELRRGFAVVLVCLHLVMKAPVWFLIARVDLTGSSSGYHRAELVDQAVNHFSEWWLIGTKDTGRWGSDIWDLQNQFVAVAVTGGLLALVLFIKSISRTFGMLGSTRKAVAGNRRRELTTWLLGCTLFAHVVASFGVNYFDQSKVGMFLAFAMTSAIAIPMGSRGPTPGSSEHAPRVSEQWFEFAH